MAAEVDFAALTVAPGAAGDGELSSAGAPCRARSPRRSRAAAGGGRTGSPGRSTPASGSRSPTWTGCGRLRPALRERGVGPATGSRVHAGERAGVPADLARPGPAGRGDGAGQHQVPDRGRRARAARLPARRRIVAGGRVRAAAAAAARRRARAAADTSRPRSSRRPRRRAGPALPGAGDPDPAGTANIQFTSGTTGRPRAACCRTGTGPGSAGEPGHRVPLPERAGRDADRAAVPLHRPAVERGRRPAVRRRTGGPGRLPPVVVLGEGARAPGHLLLLPGRDADAAAAHAGRPGRPRPRASGRCSARRSRRPCTPRWRSAGACPGTRPSA